MKSKKTKNSPNRSKSMKDMTWEEFKKITIFKPVKKTNPNKVEEII